jgi:hypothetical protein
MPRTTDKVPDVEHRLDVNSRDGGAIRFRR